MSNVSKKTIAKYTEMVSTAGRVWTEGEIVSFRSLINTKLSDAPDVREALLEGFNKSLDIAPFQLEQVQQKKGYDWIVKTQIKNNGYDLRQAKTTFIGGFELNLLHTFEYFEFTGLRDITFGSSSYRQYVPIYRLYSTNGAWFEYSSNSQGGTEVTNIGGPAELSQKLRVV